MNFEEFVCAIDDREAWALLPTANRSAAISPTLHEYLWELLRVYYVVGGMPAAVLAYQQTKTNKFQAWSRVRAVQRDLLAA